MPILLLAEPDIEISLYCARNGEGMECWIFGSSMELAGMTVAEQKEIIIRN